MKPTVSQSRLALLRLNARKYKERDPERFAKVMAEIESQTTTDEAAEETGKEHVS